MLQASVKLYTMLPAKDAARRRIAKRYDSFTKGYDTKGPRD